MDFLQEITEEYNENVINLTEAISAAIKELKLTKNGKKINDKAVREFIKNNADLVNSSALQALSAFKMYKTNKRNTITLFAKDAYQRRMVTKMVQDLVKGKVFKIHRQKWSNGGKYWELQKIKSGF